MLRHPFDKTALSVAQWEKTCYSWIIYTFCIFLVNMAGLSFYHLLTVPDCTVCSDLTRNSEVYFITTVLFVMTFLCKVCLLLSAKTVPISSILTLLVFMYGGVTHLMLFLRMNMFVFQSPATGRCVSVIEFLQWNSTCPLLYLSLLTSARKLTRRAQTIVLCEHLSIVLSGLSVAVPSLRLHGTAVACATVASVAAKVGLYRMFSPAKNTLDIRLLPYIHCIMALYFAFPVIYITGLGEWISQSTELGLFALNDVLVKILYAVLLEFCDSKIYLLNNTDLLHVKKTDTIEKAFVRFVHHEVRNPLACITAAIEELDETDAKKLYVRQLRTGMQSLERLLDDLKSLIESSTGNAHLEETLVNFPALVTNCAANIGAIEHELFTVAIKDKFPLVLGDEYRLSSLVAACAFAAYQKKADRTPVQISVSFENIGALVDVQLRLDYTLSEFSELQCDYEASPIKLRPETVRREHQLEYAFGLRLAESIADMYMGSINLIQGKRITEQSITVHLQLMRYKSTVAAVSPSPESTHSAVMRKRVLICDDNKIATKTLERMCRRADLECDIVYNGCEAVEAVQQHPGEYLVLFIDIVMPKMSGVEATRRIHLLESTLPIYGISGNAFSSDREELIQHGARECFTKPVSPEQIETTLALVMAEQLKGNE